MSKILTIPSDNPKHTHVWKFYIFFDLGIEGYRGRSKQPEIVNLNVMYDDTIFGTPEDCEKFIFFNLVRPYLLEHGYIELNDEEFEIPTDKLKPYFN